MEEQWLGNAVRFAKHDEIAACPAIRDTLQAGDRVVHYQNHELEDLAVVRAKRRVPRVVVSA